MVYRITRMIWITHPTPRAIFEADFLGTLEGAKRRAICLWKRLVEISPKPPFWLCVLSHPLPCFGETRLGNPPQGVCYLLIYF